MERTMRSLNFLVAATALFVATAPPIAAQGADEEMVEHLLEQLADPEQAGWQQIERSIQQEWSKSGSPAMDLLLDRGREALEEERIGEAIEHFTALTDHAPGFAEGWNARATAFFQAEMYGPAMADISRCLALEPRHFGAMTGLAIILEQVGEDRRALEVYRRVHAMNPHRENVSDAIRRLERGAEGDTL
jgi:tetratricopeptide (TPR) repeat protein